MISTFLEISKWLADDRKPRLEGWCQLEKAHALAATVFAIRPQWSMEIGVFSGRSLLPVALALKEIGSGIVMAIDPFSPEASAEGYDDQNAEWWKNIANHEYAWKQLNQWIDETKCGGVVNILRIKSDEATMTGPLDLLHIDGQHTSQAQKDVARFASKVRVGGIVFMDDCSWTNNGIAHVRKAADDLLALGFVKLYGIYSKGNDCEIFQRIK
jgi:predicted O-methyltransferase YrrM